MSNTKWYTILAGFIILLAGIGAYLGESYRHGQIHFWGGLVATTFVIIAVGLIAGTLMQEQLLRGVERIIRAWKGDKNVKDGDSE